MKTILIVEADDASRKNIFHEIKSHHTDWCVLEATNAYDAMEMLDQQHIDYLTVDYFLPAMNGLSLIIELKRVKQQVPSLLLTAELSPHLKSEIEALGLAHQYKPITKERIQSVLDYFDTLPQVTT